MKTIVIESLISSQKTAILENEKLTEIFIEDNKNYKTVSNVYRGIVKKIVPGIQACFVDVGFEKLAYLQLNEENNIKNGQDILVQINKEEIGTKGAKLTLEISLAGRYLVYIPSNDRVTISNKIIEEKERFRLKNIVKTLNKENLGFIIRTEAAGCSKEELEKDIVELRDKYEKIMKEYILGIGPKLLYKELDSACKYIKDNINENTEKIIVNNKEKYNELNKIIGDINKEYINKLVLEENVDVFDIHGVEKQLEKSLEKKVWLKSGGYLIIEKTEALTVIDVNTGKFTGNLKLEETIYKTNIEAAKEVCRQLKLRDIGGIIIVDFIDMYKNKYKEKMLKVLNEELSKDKRKSEVLGITKLGLVEIVRRRDKEPIDKYYLRQCDDCKGYGEIKSTNYYLDFIEKEVLRVVNHTSYRDVTFELEKEVYEDLKLNFMDVVEKIEKKYMCKISLRTQEQTKIQKINIIYNS